MADLKNGVSSPLSAITSGYHFHHISAESQEVLDEIVEALDQRASLPNLLLMNGEKRAKSRA